MGERADTLFDGADTTGTLRHTDPFSPMPVAVAVAANADTPDDPDLLTTGEDHTAPQVRHGKDTPPTAAQPGTWSSRG
jgi:hypothetical protein